MLIINMLRLDDGGKFLYELDPCRHDLKYGRFNKSLSNSSKPIVAGGFGTTNSSQIHKFEFCQ